MDGFFEGVADEVVQDREGIFDLVYLYLTCFGEVLQGVGKGPVDGSEADDVVSWLICQVSQHNVDAV